MKAGGIQKAIEMVNPDISSDDKDLASKIQLQDESKRMTDVEIGDVTQGGSDNNYTAKVKCRVDNQQQEKELSLKKDGSNFLVFNKWKVETSLGDFVSVKVPPIFGKYFVNDVELSTVEDSIYLFPGIYNVKLPESKYFKFESGQNTVVTGKVGQSLDYTIKDENITDELKNVVQKKYEEFANWCATSTSAKTPEDCPFSSTYGSSYTNIKWTVTEMSKVSVSTIATNSSSNSDKSGGGIYFVIKGGEAKMDYTTTGWFSYSSSTDYDFSGCTTTSSSYYSTSSKVCTLKIDGDNVDFYIDGDKISGKVGGDGSGATPANANTPAPAERYFVTNYPDYGICVRSNPDINGGKCDKVIQGNVLQYIEKGDTSIRMKYLDKSEVHDGHTWYNVQLPDGRQGWVRDDVVKEG